MFKFFLSASMAFTVSACAPPPPPVFLTAPADPAIRVPATGYSNVTAGAQTLRPVEPKGWEELNRQVGPKAGSAENAK
jgi:hypothetical protein